MYYALMLVFYFYSHKKRQTFASSPPYRTLVV
uniref:Uncharacterized protein n=1 Tax=Siphoviridae sp. ctmHK36 TaxID=2827931 RepID=A0A8S5TAS7_9CAUD|nr:MAG TPA: hypothetical protein [Siphoviridae sp. ctmHK36]